MKIKRIVIFILLLLSIKFTQAQKDTIIYSIEDEGEITQTENENSLLKLFPGMTEVKSMWKLNLHALTLPAFSTSFESRITKKIYYEFGITAPTILWNTDEFGWIYAGNAWTDLRFYHGFYHMKKKGRKAHSLFGNYFAIGLTLYASNLYLDYENNARKKDIEENIRYNSGEDISNYPNLLFGQRQAKGYMLMPTIKYGIQRRIWDLGYIDVMGSYAIGKSFSRDDYFQNITVQFKAGLDLQAVYSKWIKK